MAGISPAMTKCIKRSDITRLLDKIEDKSGIAEREERIEIGPGRYHIRKVGDLLHPERESQAVLDTMKVAMGSATFSAQYQQSPGPPGGNMVNWNWFNWYNPNDPNGPTVDEIVISWDTAMKPTELSDYSVGTVWGVRGELAVNQFLRPP